jgi:hypothetical protein
MTTQLHNDGESRIVDAILADVSTFRLTLFNDSTDALSDSSSWGDITTEPSGGSYSVQTASSSNATKSQNANNNYQFTLPDQTFDVSDSSADVDAYAVADDATGTLIWTSDLDQTYDLSQATNFTLQNSGLIVK